jgi:hypothetical protein
MPCDRLVRAAGLSCLFGLALSANPIRAIQQDAQEEPRSPEGLVLKTADTIEFTTDEVTWMSVDVSPDGRIIVFDLLGDLYTMPASGGEATRIVGGLSFESQPTFSPDGKTIAFLTDRSGVENLWVADPDGSNPRAVSKDQKTNDRPQIMVSPAWTPDGSGNVLAVHVPSRRRHGRARRSAATPATGPRRTRPTSAAAHEPHGRGGLAGRPLHLLRGAHRHVHLQRPLSAVADPSSRPRDR